MAWIVNHSAINHLNTGLRYSDPHCINMACFLYLCGLHRLPHALLQQKNVALHLNKKEATPD